MMNSGVCSLRTPSCLRLPHLPDRLLFQPPSLSFTCRRWRRHLISAFGAAEATKKEAKEKVIVISGPTGAGKSRLALQLAKRLNGEIVSADSIQVYQGLDVGSAKPSPNDRKCLISINVIEHHVLVELQILGSANSQEVTHHLVDILHPSEDYSVGQFFEDARQATRRILDNGRVPIVVGGTGLYLRWFIYGKPDVPKASPDITSEVYSELGELQKNEDWDAAVQLLVNAGDPKAKFLAVNDWYRLRRSLEIIKSSGSPPSSFRVPYDSFREQGDSSDAGGSESSDAMEETKTSDLDYEFICFFLSSQRLDLYRSIDYRCEDMLLAFSVGYVIGFLLGRDGILSEAGWLLKMGLHPNSNSATRAIGYRQVHPVRDIRNIFFLCFGLALISFGHAMEYLLRCRQHGGQSSAGEFYEFLSEFQKASRNFAKRQLTWFRNEHIYHWLDASKPLDTVLNFIHDAYHDWSGTLVVPEHLRMPRDISNRREATQLKSYRTKNRNLGVLVKSN
ncbi:tRNA dimethylallyltransferase 9 isoform X1 [Senna tora]|uniref:tRNA dimethylallyltransferase n=1 Tax=Senna tora TaxID=362788 RepID=A0A834X1F6_9FABA|nr:tRNA dimethylallyltransferase 9 isoform X1 [Senna tora]